MSKTIQRVLSTLFCVALLFGAVPLTAVHAEDNPTSGTCGDNLTWEYDTATATLTISGTGEMTDYSNPDYNEVNSAPWIQYSDSIKNVVINEGIINIGKYAFIGLDGLLNIEIPDSVTIIGRCSFEACDSLKSVVIGKSVICIDDYAFFGCSGLSHIVIPDSVTTIGEGSFKYCESLTSIEIPNSVTSINMDAFCCCNSLASITIPDCVMSIGDSAFEGTAYYANADNWKNDVLYINRHLIKAKKTVSETYTVESGTVNISNCAFLDCENLKSIIIPDSVTSIGAGAFGSTGLTSVTIPNSVTSIGEEAFGFCTKLTSMTIGSGITSIGDYAFFYCTGLTDVYYSSTQTLWNAIEIGEENDALLNATIHFLNDEPPHVHAYNSYVTQEPTCTEDGIRTFTCECGDTYTEPIPAAHTWSEWHTVVYPTTSADGSSERSCEKCSAMETKALPVTLCGCIVDENRITGIAAGLTLESFQSLFVSSPDITVVADSHMLGTGTKVTILYDDIEVVYEFLIFGDIDGDSWYDGTDAYYVSLLANGLIPQTALTAAQLAACDANHDGVIDNTDVSMIEQAGLLLAQVDQTAPMEELQINSVYLEYCGLIDQSLEIVESNQPTTTEETPAAQTVFGWLKALFTIVLNWLLRAF
ncbi:MAG: leucine-rich repeat protein [Clostridia bacterium]|nr:leucine-rich repeat protein [Clostridia bacterium]